MKILQVFPLFALLLFAAGSSLAQLSMQNMKADVPFAFSVADQQFPAGQYVVAGVGSQGVLAVRGSGKQFKMIVSHEVESAKPSQTSKLVFHRYGDQYILSEIWLQGEIRGRQLPRTKLEKELAARAEYEASEVMARK